MPHSHGPDSFHDCVEKKLSEDTSESDIEKAPDVRIGWVHKISIPEPKVHLKGEGNIFIQEKEGWIVRSPDGKKTGPFATIAAAKRAFLSADHVFDSHQTDPAKLSGEKNK